MKKMITSALCFSAILMSSQSIAYGGIVTDSQGGFVKDSQGNCVIFGQSAAEDCNKMDNSASMQKDEEPVIKEVINLKGVTFKTDSDELNDSSNERLQKGVADLKANPDLKVIVAGHTDNSGDELYNLELSQKRAEKVRQYLIDNGINGSRLTARGYGQTQPDVPNDTAQGRAKNRRVELRILE